MDIIDDIKFENAPELLDQWIDAIEHGATLMLTDDQKREIEIRKRQRLEETSDDYITDDDEEFQELVKEHSRVVQSHKVDMGGNVEWRELPPELIAEIEDGVDTVYVRTEPLSDYNKSDDELYHDQEQQLIMAKLSRIRNVYYDAISFRAAMLVIKEAIEYSLRNDYPWMPYEKALEDFNSGRIKYSGIIPKLYLGFGDKQVTDPKILAGIVSGEIEIVDKEESDAQLERERKRKRKKEKVVPVIVDYDVVDKDDYENWVRLHNQGYDTPISICMKGSGSVFDRLSAPSIRSEPTAEPETFDWLQEDAGYLYYCKKHGINPYPLTRLISDINKDNDGNLRPVFQENMTAFLNILNGETPQRFGQLSVAEQSRLDQAAKLEASIIESIRLSNPNL
jgi:hypothetical protein